MKGHFHIILSSNKKSAKIYGCTKNDIVEVKE